MEIVETNLNREEKIEMSNKLESIENKIEESLETTKVERNITKIKYGDLVLVYENRDTTKYFILEKGKVIQNKFGAFKHDDIYDRVPGSMIMCTRGKGYITVLSFVTHLWERCINRMTQILFNPDISIIMTFLNIRNDSIIYESGTGSGCLSTNMSQVFTTGHLYTFEFNLERADRLKSVFKTVGLNERVTVTHRDVIEDGFVLEEESLIKPDHNKCDGIFIDLPSPWLIVDHAKKVLKSGGSFVSFSPCIEQIDETMKVLREKDFLNPRMFECMYRTYNYSRSVTVDTPVFGKRKQGEEIKSVEKEINLANSRSDMRGHTGFLIYAINL